MMKETASNRRWKSSPNIVGFQHYITNKLDGAGAEDINVLNETITNALLEAKSDSKQQPKRRSELCEATLRLMQQRREMRSEELTIREEIKQINIPQQTGKIFLK